MEQIEKENVFKRDDLLNMRKNTKHKNRVALTFPFNKAAPNISKKRRNTDIYVERKYISKPIT